MARQTRVRWWPVAVAILAVVALPKSLDRLALLFSTSDQLTAPAALSQPEILDRFTRDPAPAGLPSAADPRDPASAGPSAITLAPPSVEGAVRSDGAEDARASVSEPAAPSAPAPPAEAAQGASNELASAADLKVSPTTATPPADLSPPSTTPPAADLSSSAEATAIPPAAASPLELSRSETPRTTDVVAPLPERVRPVDESLLVDRALQRYRAGYDGLDAGLVQAVYPAVDRSPLARAFKGLASQSLVFDACDVQIRGAVANATCRGTASYVPRVGSPEPRVEHRVWTFTLRRGADDWTIERAQTSR